MLTVDEASAYTGLAGAVVVPFVALLREAKHIRSSGTNHSSDFFSRASIRGIGLGLGVMFISAFVFHFLIGDRYNHMAFGVWSLAFVGIIVAAPMSSAVAVALLRTFRPNGKAEQLAPPNGDA